MQEMKHVKDFSGKLIPLHKARKIDDQYYEEGVSCILMPDGLWYRIITGKIRFDWQKKIWVFTKESEHLAKGLVDDGSMGYFTASEENVRISYKKDAFIKQFKLDLFNRKEVEETTSTRVSWIKSLARNSEIAEKFGFVESVYDGIFYKAEEMTEPEKLQAKQPNTPNGERTNVYSLEDDQNRNILVDTYNKYNPKISKSISKLASFVPYTFGCEYETSIGFIPARLRGNLGVRPLRDGSISGIEYVTIPLREAKGINTIYELCAELTKRAALNLQCSVHFHFGNVRRDKLYILSLWTLGEKIQDELLSIFPFSRVNSIRPDGKVYCKPLPDLKIKAESLFKTKNKEDFQQQLVTEFNKIYAFLNDNHKVGEVTAKKRVKQERVGILGGKEMKLWKLATKVHCFSTKAKTHSIRGHKWDRPQR